jgi:hypothetical protein
MSRLLDAALDYAARGWPVYPCAPGEKCPLGRLVSHDFKDATTDAEIIRRWWKDVPKANIGLTTGVAFDVFDVDGDEGWSSLETAVSTYGPLPSSPTSKTGGGGAHILFLPTGSKNRTGFLNHIDWKAASGCIVARPRVSIPKAVSTSGMYLLTNAQ